MNAGEMMEQFVRDRSYFHLKRMEQYKSHFQQLLKQSFQEKEENRIVHEAYGYVAKWRKMPIYDTDHIGLNHFLHDHGLFLPLASLPLKGLPKDVEQDIATFALPPTYSVSTNPNKKGRVVLEDIPNIVFSVEEQWSHYVRSDREHALLSNRYEKLKKNMLECQVLLTEKKIKHEFGSVSLREKKAGYDISAILEWYGEEFLIENARVENSKLDVYMAKGLIHPKDIEPFRKVINMRADFILMTIESESSMIKNYEQRLRYLSKAATDIA
ncbi:hypothetical protein ACH0BF_19585 [Pseudobacillus sp. 179-B 2D1 NHS]|uniref:hypothetical protein n=1 Tax=Pseudobacillus sp. 179-B 2D1 NHS TaxID=3374292 RepID=UPI00387A70BF